MFHALAANAVLIVHALFVLWVLLGALAVARWPRLAWLHLPAVAWVVWLEWTGAICPLTPLEVHLLQAAGQAGYSGGFIEHYALAALYPEGLTRQMQWLLGLAVLVLNAAAYGWLLWRRRVRPAPSRP